MRKTKESKDVKEPKEVKPKVRAEKESVEEAVPMPALESEAVQVRRAARSEGFKALGDPIRLAICEYLAACVPSAQTAGAVCRAVTGDKKITAKVSHHLKELRRAGLIAMHKNGKNVLCALDANGTQALSAYLSSWTAADGAKKTNSVTDSVETSSETKTEKASKTNDRDTASDSTNDPIEFSDANAHARSRPANAA